MFIRHLHAPLFYIKIVTLVTVVTLGNYCK
nr:MAG TPA: hypothetical protein [Caudoviricetes sp.]